MDVGSLLAEAAETIYDKDDEFENDGSNNSVLNNESAVDKKSASEILRSASDEVARAEKREVKIALEDSAIDLKIKSAAASNDSEELLAAVSEAVHRDRHDLHGRNYETTIPAVDENPSINESENDSDDEVAYDPNHLLDQELMIAASKGAVRNVMKLLDSGARYNARDRHGWTPLMWAASEGHEDVAEVLIDYAKDKLKHRRYIGLKDNLAGWTALHVRRILLLYISCVIITSTYFRSVALKLYQHDD